MDEHHTDDLGRRPASRRVADVLRQRIEAGTYAPDERLPSYRALMAEHGIARNTAQAAVRLLEQEGRVVVRHGSGAFVLKRPSPVPPETQLREVRSELRDLQAELREAGNELAKIGQRVGELADRLSSSG